jgi:hypothetical protein
MKHWKKQLLLLFMGIFVLVACSNQEAELSEAPAEATAEEPAEVVQQQ